jgi:hypothetical protein
VGACTGGGGGGGRLVLGGGVEILEPAQDLHQQGARLLLRYSAVSLQKVVQVRALAVVHDGPERVHVYLEHIE